ncbi:NACHT domain-containing protein [Streptomyces humi]
MRFYEALEKLYEMAGKPAPAVLVRQSKTPGNPAKLNTSSLSQWLNTRTAIPDAGEPFNFLINYLLGKAKNAGTKKLPQLGHYQELRRYAAQARDRALGSARRENPTSRGAKPSAALKAYVQAASALCAIHPTLGIGRIGNAPALTDVYEPQRAIRVGRWPEGPAYQDADGLAEGALLYPATVLRGGSCLVVAGPGGGKSSLLRQVLRAGLELGDAEQPIPVLVPASALAGPGPLTQAIARHVKTELGSGWDYPPESVSFFDRPPQPNTTWLVLVDGLDEVIDPALRRQVLEKIRHGLRADDGIHQFVVTSRPVAESELIAMGTETPRLELQPFDGAGLTGFVHRWLAAHHGASAETRADALVRRVERSSLATLARIPLMATMLCQVIDVNPDQEIADSRGQLYRQFTDLLQDRQFQGGLVDRVEEALKPYGGADLAADTIRALPRMMEQFATEHLSGRTGMANRTLMKQRREPIPETVWDAVSRDLVRSTGLVTEQAGELTFLHRTLAEYLVVRRLATNPRRLKRRLRTVLRFGGRGPGPVAIWRIIWGDWYQRKGDSHIGFLLDYARDLGIDSSHMLRRIILFGGVEGSAFVTRQREMGTHIPRDIFKMALDRLARTASRPWVLGTERVLAVEMLLRCDDSRGEQLLTEICADTPPKLQIAIYFDDPLFEGREPSYGNRQAALQSHLQSEWRGLYYAFYSIAHNRDLRDQVRALAIKAMAWYLRMLEDEEGLEELRVTVADDSLDSAARAVAESALYWRRPDPDGG